MRKNIKYSASFIIIVLSLMFGGFVFAEESATTGGTPIACTMDAKLCPDGTSVGRTGPNCEFVCPGDNIKKEDPQREELRNKFKAIKDEIGVKKEEGKNSREEFKTEVKNIKDEVKNKIEENKSQLDGMIQNIKTKRLEFKTELLANKEQAKLKIAEAKARFKESLTKIKDENKKISAEKILDIIQALNIKVTDNLFEKTDQIENVLVSIDSRITKAETNGIDVTQVKTEADKARIAITTARETITAQSTKVYEVNATDEATLKTEMKKLRDLFNSDIKIVREKVKLAHVAVKTTATTLAKIPKINEEVSATGTVEEKTTTDTN